MPKTDSEGYVWKDGFSSEKSHPSVLYLLQGILIMNKFGIRVVKRNDIAVASKIKVVCAAKIENVIRHERVDAVNEWVTDRRESIRLEKMFSDGKILAWKMVPVNLKETLN